MIAAAAEIPELGCPTILRRHSRYGRNQIALLCGPQAIGLLKSAPDQRNCEIQFYSTVPVAPTVAPRLLWHDPDSNSIVLEYLSDAVPASDVSLWRLFAAFGSLGRTLARIHSTPSDLAESAMPQALPSLDPVPVGEWLDSSDAARELIRMVQTSELLRSAHASLQDHDGPQGLIHGDLKLDNVLLVGSELSIIDWELCGRGPISYDLSSLLAALLDVWIRGIRPDPATRPEEWVAEARAPLGLFSRAAQLFLLEYSAELDGTELTLPELASLLSGTSGCLVVRAWVGASLSRRLSMRDHLRLTVAESILEQPEELFGELRW